MPDVYGYSTTNDVSWGNMNSADVSWGNMNSAEKLTPAVLPPVPSEVCEMYAAALDQIKMLRDKVREQDGMIRALREEQIAFDKKWREIMEMR